MESFPALNTAPVCAYPFPDNVMPERLTDRGGSITPSHTPVPVVVIISPLKLNETLSVELTASVIETVSVPLNTVLPVASTPENITEPVIYTSDDGRLISMIFGISSIIDALLVVSTQTLSVNVAWIFLIPFVGLNVTGTIIVPADARVPVILSVIPLPEMTYETGFATEI